MASLNKVMLIGNLTRDPELKYIPSGSAVGTLNIAVNRKYKAQDGSLKDDVCFVRVTVWGKPAENCNEYLSKGSPVYIEGRLQFKSWEKDGQKRSSLDVVAERVQFLGGKKGAATGGDSEAIPEEPIEGAAGGGSEEDKPPF
ncbi:MAG: single-stranded DNA-binding protein [Candidatus Firestonebacteria bacterium RIFOXYC2_FULL_39_67]|nr:MAG: single-stranded DNA-binding protein [Candidatus Firestonebacteria bacterium RIFOXYD2_FULL_39_29]OGF56200.1 MAG: single-stranded DNA-binding protein [Candidatus Firestonebacteria bacterium RIFOXYC2_FULL_39_67]OGF57279.1 MAG: single-stranded DNA-binding protein [Candidatus Firestonebacteria bacterium RifOxyC12_full_39_7]